MKLGALIGLSGVELGGSYRAYRSGVGGLL